METKVVMPASLRSYQREICDAVMRSVREGAGRSFSVMVSRQGGKNEVSAWIEAALLLGNRHKGGQIVKTAPTLSPQLSISKQRLLERLRGAGLDDLLTVKGDTISLGAASITFLSGQPEANVVGHTASLLLEVDEAQHIEAEKFERDFRPMILSTGATVVFYGTAWEADSLLEVVKAHHIELEADDGIRRHFEYDYEAVSREFPEYRERALAQRALLGENNPVWLSQYCLRPQQDQTQIFSPAELEAIRGSHTELLLNESGALDPVNTVDELYTYYVAGLDVGGRNAGYSDPTVMTIARVFYPNGDGDSPPRVEVVKHLSWQAPFDDVAREIVGWHEAIRLRRVAMDATGIGHHPAAMVERALGRQRVDSLNFTVRSKSELLYELRDTVAGGRLSVYQEDNAHSRQLWHELSHARVEVKNGLALMGFSVPARYGHDDYLVSLALAVHAAINTRPRIGMSYNYLTGRSSVFSAG